MCCSISSDLLKIKSHSISSQPEELEVIGSLNSFKEDRLGYTCYVLKRFIKSVFFICDLDPFRIYKSNYKHSNDIKYQIYHLPELRLPNDNFDLWRSRFRRPVSCFVCYIASKYLTISFIQIISCIFKRNNDQRTREKRHISAAGITVIDAGLSYNYQLRIEYLEDLGSSITGYRVWSTATSSILIIFTAALVSVYFFIIIPGYYKRQPLDSFVIRFMLDPTREIRRTDLVIKQHLDQILHESSRRFSLPTQYNNVATMRPSTLTLKTYFKLFKYLLVIVALILPSIIQFEVILYYFYYSEMEEMYQFEESGNWSLFELTLKDLFTLIELVLVRLSINCFITLLMVLISLHLFSLYDLTRSLKEELQQCLTVLKAAVIRIDSYCPKFWFDLDQIPLMYDQDSRQTNSTQTIESQLFHSTNYVLYSLFEEDRRERSVEIHLLRAYLKLVVTKSEFNRVTKFLGQFLEFVLVVVTAVLIIVAITFLIDSRGSHWVQVFWMFLAIGGINPLLFGCAFVFTRAIECEKIAWSILAELQVYHDMAPRLSQIKWHTSDNGLFGLLSVRWFRLVGSLSFSDKHNSVRPFGLSLSYEQVLRMNFFLLSIVSLKQMVGRSTF